MDNSYIVETTFNGRNFSKKDLSQTEYEACIFNNCIFSNTSLYRLQFIECSFNACDFSASTMPNTAIRDTTFNDCKLLGTNFEDCNKLLLSMDFMHCQLNLASFDGLPLKGTTFDKCMMQETNFTDVDLTDALIKECDLQAAIFDHTNLQNADLSTSYNFAIDPESNNIKGARFSSTELIGLLYKYDIEIE